MVSFDFLNNLTSKSSKVESNYLSLTLTKDKVLATIWTFEGENVKILGFAHKTFTDNRNIVHQAAIAIDSAAEKAKTDVEEVIYGLSANWFEDGKVSGQTANLLKKLSEDLELKAQAFVPLSAAINHFLKIEESVTPHAILIGILEDFCEVSQIKNNKIVSNKILDSHPTAEKIKNIVGQLKTEESLPARIIVYGTGQDTQIVHEIQNTNWQDLFTQEPRINFIGDLELSKAVAYAQAADILGHDPVAANLGMPSTKDEKEEPKSDLAKADDFGFIEGEDILQKETVISEPEKLAKTDESRSQPQIPTKREDYAVDLEQEPQRKQPSEKESLAEQFATIGWLPRFLEVLKEKSSLKKILIGIVLLLILILLASFILGRTITNAEVIIKVNAKPQEANFSASVLTSPVVDIGNQQIPGQQIDASVSGNQKAATTGSKKVGNNAKGQVTVFNITATPQTFSKSTTLITKGLKFTLDEEVEATSASKPGQASQTKANITATEVGPQYNLDQGQQFNFTQFDEFSYWAQNDAPFTGGDEKQVSVVAQDDMDKLSKSLLDSLSVKAKDELKTKVTGKKIEDDAITVQVTKKQFDKNLDEEASIINLDMEVAASTIAYDENDLKEALAQLAQTNAPQNLESKAENIEILEADTKVSTNGLSISGKFRANLTPKFDQDQLKAKIAGRDQKEARTVIKEIPEVVDLEIKLSPNTFLFSSLPTNKDKIKLTFEVAK